MRDSSSPFDFEGRVVPWPWGMHALFVVVIVRPAGSAARRDQTPFFASEG
jgi:hypothetical protein